MRREDLARLLPCFLFSFCILFLDLVWESRREYPMSCDSLHSYFLSTLFIVLGALRLTTTFIAALGLRDRDIHVELRLRHPCRASTPLVCAPAVGQAKGQPLAEGPKTLGPLPERGFQMRGFCVLGNRR